MPPATLTTVIFASRPIRVEVQQLRAVMPPSGVPVMEAHVTTKGTFTRLAPEDALTIIQRVCAQAASIPLQCRGLQAWFHADGEHVSLIAPTWRHPALIRLHNALQSALGDPDRTLYGGDRPHWFAPHLTLVQEMPRDRLAEAVAAVRELPDWRFDGTDVALMQQAEDLTWREVGRAPLAGERDDIRSL
jgi:2'-5' RNA ligase